MPLPSQDLRQALDRRDPGAVANLGRFLDGLVILAGNEAKTISSTAGSGHIGGGSAVIAGNGLTGGGVITSDVTLNVGAGSGVTVTADAVAVDSTVARSTWAVTAGAGLAGGGTLASGGITLDVGAGTGITVAADSVAVDQSFTPTWTGAHIWSTTATFNGTTSFPGGIGGSLIPTATDTYDLGSTTKLWRKGYLAELDAVLFAQNVVSVIGGWLMVSKGEGVLGADLGSGVGDTTASLGTTANITAHATTGDIILFRGLGQVEYMKVTAGTGPTWTVTRDLDGSGRNAWPAGSVFVNLGYSTTGRIEINASSTPRISIIKQGTTYNAQTEMVRIGDLNGWGPFVAEQYGWAVGDYSGGNYAYYGPTSGFKIGASAGALSIDANGLNFTQPSASYAYPQSVTWGTVTNPSTLLVSYYITSPSSANIGLIANNDNARTGSLVYLRAITDIGTFIDFGVKATTDGADDYYAYLASANLDGLIIGASTLPSAMLDVQGSIATTGDIDMATGKWVGLSSSAGRILFTDAATDTIALKTADVLMDANKFFVNDTSDANLTVGMVLNQGANDDKIITLKSSDIAHGMTTLIETDTFGSFNKQTALTGGLTIQGWSEDEVGLQFDGIGTNDDTGRATTANGYIQANAYKKSGTTVGNPGANANLFVVRANGATQFLVDFEGDIHMNATSNINAWDDYDDLALLTGLRVNLLAPTHPLREVLSEWAEYARPVLARTGVVSYNDDGHHFISLKGFMGLTVDTLRQMAFRQAQLESRLARIEESHA